MAVKQIAQIKADILATIYENSYEGVTAQHEQDRFIDIADSYYNRITDQVATYSTLAQNYYPIAADGSGTLTNGSLYQDDSGNVFMTDGKLFSSANGNIVVDFQSGYGYFVSTDAQSYSTPFMSLTPSQAYFLHGSSGIGLDGSGDAEMMSSAGIIGTGDSFSLIPTAKRMLLTSAGIDIFHGSGISIQTGNPSGDYSFILNTSSYASFGFFHSGFSSYTNSITVSSSGMTFDANAYVIKGSGVNRTTIDASGNIMMLAGYLTLANSPTSSMHAATKNYVDNLLTGLAWKKPVIVAAPGNQSLSSNTVDSTLIPVDGRVLLWNQTTATQNGIYRWNGSALVRTDDADTSDELTNATLFVQSGTYADRQFTCTNTSPNIGVDNIVFVQIAGAGTYTNGTYLKLTGNVFDIDFTTFSTTQITEGSNLYYTNARVDTRVAAYTGDVTLSGTAFSIGAGKVTNAMLVNSTISGISLGSNLNSLTVDNSSLQLDSGTTFNGSVARTISVKALGITNAMLAGNIASSKLVGTDIATVGTITTGVWNGTAISYSYIAAMTSAQFAGIISDETGTGALVFANSPTLITPVLGVASATSMAITGTAGAGFITFLTQSSQPSYGANGIVIYANSSGRFAWRFQGDSYERSFLGTLSADRQYTWPDLSGTIATIDGGQTFTSAIWNGTKIAVAYGGTNATSLSGIESTSNVLYGPADESYYRITGTSTNELWYTQAIASYTPITISYGKNVDVYVPFVVAKTCTIDKVSIEVTTASGTAGAVARVGIYNSSNIYPSSLVIDVGATGTMAVDSTGVKSVTISQQLTPGLYFLVINHNGTSAPTFRGVPVSAHPPILGIKPAMGAANVVTALQAVRTYAAFPSTAAAGAIPYLDTGTATIALRFSA